MRPRKKLAPLTKRFAEQVLGQPDDADRDHAERRRDIRKRPLGPEVAVDSQDRAAELGGNRNRQQG